MACDRWDEKLAEKCIATELHVHVSCHDDNSADSMYDLDIVYWDNGRSGAVEVTAAADPDSIALGKFVFDGERWIEPGLAGGWMASLEPRAKWKAIQSDLPGILGAMEGRGMRVAQPEVWWEPGPYDAALRTLGVLHLFQSDATDYPGSVYLTIDQGPERTGGAVPTDGRPLLEWLAGWVARPDKADNVSKLAASDADERHLFVIVPAFADAPFRVTDLLMRDDAPLPDDDPDVPAEITHVWLVSTWTSGAGMRWARGSGWSSFEKVFAE